MSSSFTRFSIHVELNLNQCWMSKRVVGLMSPEDVA
jgi:hypothetical protein